MILVSPDDIGTPGYSRAVREGVLVPLTPVVAAPLDVPATQGLRALALSPLVPQGAVVTGLAGLWLDGLAGYPSTLDVLRRTGTHRAPRRMQVRSRIRIHAGDPGPRPVRDISHVRCAHASRCAVDALRWGPLEQAISAVWTGMRSGAIDPSDVSTALAETPPDRSRRRAQSAWNAIEKCWRAPSAEAVPRAA